MLLFVVRVSAKRLMCSMIRTVMTRGVIPAVERHEDVILITSAHYAFEALIEFVWIMSTDALHPHFTDVLAYLPRLGDECSWLAAFRARLNSR